MESKMTRVKPQDLGLAVLQTRGKATYNLPQRDHHRILKKGLSSSKGLGEIEAIENEEVSIKMMQSLERFMRSYPAVWTESSVQHLLVEIADTRYASFQNSEAEERLQTIINRILVPMANIMEAEQGFMMAERQKIQEATLALQRVEEECHLALGDLKQEHDLSSRDLKELSKALEESRMAADEAGRKLDAKEKQLQEMLQKQRNLIIRLVCGGPNEFLRWAREEIQSCGLVDLKKELEHAWGLVMEDKMLISDQSSNNSPAKVDSPKISPPSSWNIEYKDSDKSKLHNLRQLTSATVKLLCVVGLEVLVQVRESYYTVKGPLSIPSVTVGFWIGIARRMTFLAVATLFPQLVMEKTPVGTTTTEITRKSHVEEKELYLRREENGWRGVMSSSSCKSRRANVEDEGPMTTSTRTTAGDSALLL